MNYKDFTKKEKAAFVSAIIMGAVIILLLIVDFSGLCKGISDIFPLFLGIALMLVYYLQRNSGRRFMPRFYFVCGVMMAVLSVFEIILYFV